MFSVIVDKQVLSLLATQDITKTNIIIPLSLFEKYEDLIVKKIGFNLEHQLDLMSLYKHEGLFFYLIVGGLFSLLTAFIFLLCSVLIKGGVDYITMLLFVSLEYMLLHAFNSCNLLVFYVYFESVLIPMFILILRKGGGPRKVISAFYMFMYTTIFSAPMLYMLIVTKHNFGTLNVFGLYHELLDENSPTAHLL